MNALQFTENSICIADQCQIVWTILDVALAVFFHPFNIYHGKYDADILLYSYITRLPLEQTLKFCYRYFMKFLICKSML